MTEKTAPRGNPNPSPETRFKAGDNANPQGKTSHQKRNEMRAAELASQMTVEMLEGYVGLMTVAESNGMKAGMLSSDLMNLIKEAQSRAHGTPKASVDLTSEDGSMSPSAAPDAVLDALTRKHADT